MSRPPAASRMLCTPLPRAPFSRRHRPGPARVPDRAATGNAAETLLRAPPPPRGTDPGGLLGGGSLWPRACRGEGWGHPVSAHGWRIRELRQWPSGLPLPGRLGKAAKMSPCLPAGCCSRSTLGPARAHPVAQPPGESGPAPLRAGAPGPLAPKGHAAVLPRVARRTVRRHGVGVCVPRCCGVLAMMSRAHCGKA